MSFTRYYGGLLRRGEECVPTAVEAQKDYQRVLALSQAALVLAG